MKATQIKMVHSVTHEEFEALTKMSLAEGYAFVQQLVDEYQSGTNRFDGQGGVLLGGYVEHELIAVGGVQRDPYLNDPAVGRVRHVYVQPTYRRLGVGRLLMGALIEHARNHFEILTLRTPTTHGDAFYTTLGFSREPRFAEATHWMSLTAL
jgi:GNAT superfamily N-acetyltransferase